MLNINVHIESQAIAPPSPSLSHSQQRIWKEDMRSYLPFIPSGVFTEKAHRNSLSLSALSLTLVEMCGCICGNLSKQVPQFAYLLRDPITWRAKGNCP